MSAAEPQPPQSPQDPTAGGAPRSSGPTTGGGSRSPGPTAGGASRSSGPTAGGASRGGWAPLPGGATAARPPAAGAPVAPAVRTTQPPRLRRPVRAGGSTRAPRPAAGPRRQLPRLSRARVLVLLAGLLVLLGVAAYALFFSSWLTLQTVQVEGNTTVSTAEVLSTANVTVGDPLARVDTDAVSDRVAGLLPVASVELHRSWPHKLVITVSERQPALVVADANGFSVLDPSGFAFRHVDTAPNGVPVFRPAGSAPVTARVQDAVLTVVGDLPADLRTRVMEITAATLDSISLHLTGGVTVVWGSDEDGPRKAQVLTELMRHPATAYNVSAPDVPAIRPVPTT